MITSITQSGLARGEQYILELQKAFERLASFPKIGRDAGQIREAYFQFQHARHNVFYQTADAGIFVVRVLHQKQLPENYF